ncbi:exopolysaccharide biosynthesis polyprenyl glycosylphosphotransferase [Vaginella massiliensis]|uniref:exopolysaccharide biosynthesis polyprenyl glycosylphosphotransferase n=1 Tax=Vaginella massiliensis TaxID=1816680 RepID=UPI000839429F|nr:exopolysaccharide biosynthesis polyprenyl glycosylphosphotransferase [Vaginella massiliensis]
MYKKRNWFIHYLLRAYDLSCLVIFFFVFLHLQYKYFYPKEHLPLLDFPDLQDLVVKHYKALILLIVSWFFIAKNGKLYHNIFQSKFITIVKRISSQIFYFSIILFAISGLKEYDLFHYRLSIAFAIVMFTMMIASRFFLFFFYRERHLKGKDLTNVLIIDTNINTPKFIEIIKGRKELGFHLVNHLESAEQFGKNRDKGLMVEDVDFEQYLADRAIRRIFISQFGNINKEFYKPIYDIAEKLHIEISYIPYSIYNNFTNLNIEYIDTLPILEIRRFPLDLVHNQLIKTLFDKVFALFVCVSVLSWLIPIIGLLIYFDSKGPIFFVQKRNGLNGQEFGCIKFRTMRETKLNSIKATVRNDDRITRIGNFLRKTSLDETPQFINVLLGDMSIVGPRPHMISQDSYYKEIIERYNLRHYVKPGITGLSQVKGHRGAIDCDADMEKRIITDIYYVRNWSFLLDIQIIYLTIMLVIKGDENAI